MGAQKPTGVLQSLSISLALNTQRSPRPRLLAVAIYVPPVGK